MKLSVRREDVRVPGFLFSGVACGLKEDGRKDVALIFAEEPAAVAGAFTTNRFAAPPVRIARPRVRAGRIQAVLVNTKSANAGTGPSGLERAHACCRLAAGLLGIAERRVVPCSTGKIGLPLPWRNIRRGIRLAVGELSPAGLWDAAEAIRTTDAFPKVAARRIRFGGRVVTVAGLAKGAGMIHPQMATTLAYVVTDAACLPEHLGRILHGGLSQSFNAISVDGDTSTNDTALLLASGASGMEIRAGSAAGRRFTEAVAEVLADLARMIVADGEGASKVVRVRVSGARSRVDADRAARAVANSLLVKTALYGADPNWGRIACAVGYSGAVFRAERTAIRIGGIVVSRAGEGTGKGAERRARRAMLGREFAVDVELGAGRYAATILTCDLGTDYVRFNSEYSS
jgi:glutamate N-acetyltransferase / amino-acid N-acetyltransferase